MGIILEHKGQGKGGLTTALGKKNLAKTFACAR